MNNVTQFLVTIYFTIEVKAELRLHFNYQARITAYKKTVQLAVPFFDCGALLTFVK